ncbi:MAG: hypothetical protein FD187_3175 [bacterium]|nr:MAG: hypothetical protein FD187_3175 [bacterium]
MLFLLGIDDTDRPGAPDTSALALTLGQRLAALSLARLMNVSCHQLLQHPAISFTTQNMACCLLLDAEPLRLREIDLVSREFLRRDCSPASNPGFALADWNTLDPEITAWGRLAKLDVLQRQDAMALGRRCGISIAGFAGSGAGVIGALAAVGLRYDGNDGWLSWMPGLPALRGVYTPVELLQQVHFDRMENPRGKKPAVDDRINIEKGIRPLLRDGKSVLLLAASKKGAPYEWEVTETDQ